MNNQEKIRMQRLSGLLKESYEGEFIYENEENLEEAWAGIANILSKGSSALGQKASEVGQSVSKGVSQFGQKAGQAIDKAAQKASDWYKEGEVNAVKKKTEELRGSFERLKAEFEKLTGQKLTGNMIQQINQIMAYKKS